MAPTIEVRANTARSDVAETNSSRPLTIGLGVVLPLALISLAAALVMAIRNRHRFSGCGFLFSRDNSPIDDDEIESWKSSHLNEKKAAAAAAAAATAAGELDSRSASRNSSSRPGTPTRAQLTRHSSDNASSTRKPTGIVTYQPYRASEHEPGQSSPSYSPPPQSATSSTTAWSPSHTHAYPFKSSMDSIQSPVLARAPNARPGLTDESIRGDAPYVVTSTPSRRQISRQASRLAKHPSSASSARSARHRRSRSSHNSAGTGGMRRWYGHSMHVSYASTYGSTSPMVSRVSADYAATEHELESMPSPMSSPRFSIDNFCFFDQPAAPLPVVSIRRHHRRSHPLVAAETSRRQSLDTNFVFGDDTTRVLRPEDIGRAIG